MREAGSPRFTQLVAAQRIGIEQFAAHRAQPVESFAQLHVFADGDDRGRGTLRGRFAQLRKRGHRYVLSPGRRIAHDGGGLIGVAPVGDLANLPDTALRRTFDKYWENSAKRMSAGATWDAYTPYELRTIGTFVRLGEKQRALSMLDFFFQGQRPAAWRQWAEVVWHARDTPKCIGDMPHTWVGSDYIRSVLDMFAYDRASDSALVVGAGIAERWVRVAPGVKVRGLGTPYGPIDFDIRARGDSVVAHIAGALRVPPGGIAFRSPVDGRISRARVDGRTVTPSSNGEVVVRQLPATIILTIGRTR